MITADDFTFLRRAIGIAAAAITTGDDPYGSLLAGHERAALARYQAEGTPMRRDAEGRPGRLDMRRARWPGDFPAETDRSFRSVRSGRSGSSGEAGHSA